MPDETHVAPDDTFASLPAEDDRARLDTGVGHDVSGAALVRAIERRTTRKGDAMLKVTLSNGHGERTATIWSRGMPQWTGINIGDAVEIEARMKPGFRDGPPELEIERVVRLGADHPVRRELNPASPVPAVELRAELARHLEHLSPPWRALANAVLDEAGRERFLSAPAAKIQHHATIGGLADHALEVARIALTLAELPLVAAHVDRDALLVGALLHDVAKVDEYVWEGVPIALSALARLRYHTSSGTDLVAMASVRHELELTAAGCTPTHVRHLQHVIESHHLTREHGSLTPPRSLEALIVHLADLCSARTRGWIESLAQATAEGDGWWTTTRWPAEALWVLRRDPSLVPQDGGGTTAPERAGVDVALRQDDGEYGYDGIMAPSAMSASHRAANAASVDPNAATKPPKWPDSVPLLTLIVTPAGRP